jgi:hypothetical protein
MLAASSVEDIVDRKCEAGVDCSSLYLFSVTFHSFARVVVDYKLITYDTKDGISVSSYLSFSIGAFETFSVR